ncbi:hypothetical protein QNH26_24150 [Peribacillus frigoritolerans]|uniref:hypothetical protein n=1 Tax=Peribacillus frigoritolerans TaxID=450367 RepID=UPI0024C15E9B|nr:hypothetical protein [Peribacillus frigoritolerans]WHX66667.1 hypothetical protein QNH26_24150 [Peribacillus frigoritolerans]
MKPYIGWKKIATLLPKYWLAETPQALSREGLADSPRKGSGFLKSTDILNKKRLFHSGNAYRILFFFVTILQTYN